MTEISVNAGPVDPLRMSLLALLLEDPNPIHLDSTAARQSGLGDRAVNQGPANIALMINALTKAFPGSRIATLRLRFLHPILADDAVRIRITSLGEADGDRSRVEVLADRSDGQCAVIGEAHLEGLPPAGPRR